MRIKRLRPMMLLAGLTLLAGTLAARAAGPVAPDRIAKAGKIVFCTDVGFPPWEMMDPATLHPAGFDIDLAAAIARALGVTSEHKNIAFNGLIPALQAGQCDAIMSGLYDKPERRAVVDFVDYAATGDSLIVKADSTLRAVTLQDMAGKKVALGTGTAGEGELDKANEQLKAAGKTPITVVPMPTSAVAFQQVSAGLVDAYLGSTDQAAYYNTQKPGTVKLAGPPLFSLPVGIATLHKDSDLHQAFEAALQAIKQNGEYDRIVQTWAFQDLVLH